MRPLNQLVAGVSMLALAACNTTGSTSTQKIKPGERPDIRSTEAGLWYHMDKMETGIATSALVEQDPELNAYVKGVMCKVVQDYCGDIRLFVINQPYFNASMAPNGSMYVWTGFLLRAQTEDQLAAVIGHEFAHYQHRHSLQQFEMARAASEFLAFFSIATAGIGAGIVGLTATIGGIGAIQGFSRDLEAEADDEGLKYTIAQGYNPWEAVEMWENIKEEKEVSEEDSPSLFWASHPPTEERIAALQAMAEKSNFSKVDTVNTNTRFHQMHRKWRDKWLREMLAVTPKDEALVVIGNLKRAGMDEATVAYYQGEIYRRAGTQEDLEKAKEAYGNAINFGASPPKTLKKLAVVMRRLGDKAASAKYLKQYLNENPRANDYEQVKSYLSNLTGAK